YPPPPHSVPLFVFCLKPVEILHHCLHQSCHLCSFCVKIKINMHRHQVKYRMEGNKARTTSMYDGEARDITHAKHVSELVSKVLYRQQWDETKDRYHLPPDSPELVQAVKNAANFSKKRYTEDWDEEKVMFCPYIDSPELQRVAKAQEALSDVQYKKGHNERKAKYTSLADPPEVELAKKVGQQYSDVSKTISNWLSNTLYKCQINKKTETQDCVCHVHSEEMCFPAYEDTKSEAEYNTLPATENPLLRQLRYKVYKAEYEQTRGSSINYCETPKFQMDSVLKQFNDTNYKNKYDNEVKGHYIGSYEDLYTLHCQKVEEMKSDKNYKADYDDMKTSCFFPQTITAEYEATKKLQECSDKIYRQHPDTVKFTQVVDSPVQVQAAINAHQLSDMNYKAKYEETKFKCTLPPDYPFFMQSRVNAFNLSDNCYKYDWEQIKAKEYEMTGDAIPILAARAHTNIASDVQYKKAYEKDKGHHVGFRSLQDDPLLVHYMHVARIQSDRNYKKDYHQAKVKFHSPVDMLSVAHAKHASAVQTYIGYRQYLHDYRLLPDAVGLELARNMNYNSSDRNYKMDYDTCIKGIGWVPIGSLDVEKAKAAAAALDEKTYRQHPDTFKFTSIPDSMSMELAKKEYKASGEKFKHTYHLPPDTPELMQARYNAANISQVSCSIHLYRKLIYNLQDDPLLVHYMQVARMQSDRNYKQDYHQAKLKYHSPVDMMSVVQAKKASAAQTMIGYKNIPHSFLLLPDNLKWIAYCTQKQSNNLYKSDYTNYYKGSGWLPIGSLDVEKAKAAKAALDERGYRQHPSTFKFTSKADAMNTALALIMDKKAYTAAWEADKLKVHIMPDSPEILLAKANALTMSTITKLYKSGLVEMANKGYNLKADAIPIVAAKAGTTIASNYKYKLAYEKARGHHVGFRSLQDDPLLVHYMQVARIQSDRNYKKDYHESKLKYHSPVDMMSVVQAKKTSAAQTMIGYRQFNPHYTVLPDAMNLQLARNMHFINQYKSEYESFMKGIGWIPIGSLDVEKAKTAGQIFSEKQYRQHPSNFKFTKDMHSMDLALKAYTAAWETDKLKVHIMPDSPEILLAKANALTMSNKLYKSGVVEMANKGYNLKADAIPIVAAKAGTTIASNYKYKLAYEKARGHHVGFRSFQDDPLLVHYMQVARMQSDRNYKKDYHESKLKYHSPVDMMSVVQAKKTSAAQTMIGYRQFNPHYTVLPDAMNLQLARNMHFIASDNQYKSEYESFMKGIGWIPIGSLDVEKAKTAGQIFSEKQYRQHPSNFKFTKDMHSMDLALDDKTLTHIMPDAMDIVLARGNRKNYSEKLYKLDNELSKKKGHNLREDAIPVQAAKASTAIASDYKYKTGYRKQVGHHIGARSIKDDPLLMLALNSAKIASDVLYKKDFNQSKTRFHLPVDMLSIEHAKKCQVQVNDFNYRTHLHQWTCLPDSSDVVQARHAYDLQSDIVYKEDLKLFQGIGWVPIGSLDVEKVKKAGEALSERKYRQHPNWEKDKTNVHVMPDAMDILLAKANRVNYSVVSLS
uniref:SH3 domain-containing protein n=1 Tax=Monopterus albus TaxID=43700 RepID=A0A3Q3IH06_MONAL